MELIDLKFFTTVAEHLHFGRAAQELLCTTSHVSHRIRRLEHQLGVRLFDRTTRQVALTPRGRVLLVEAQAIIAGVEGMRRIATEPDGVAGIDLVYSPASAAVIMKCLSELSELDPRLSVRLDPRANSMEVIRAVGSRQAAAGATQSLNDEVDGVQIGENPLALYVPSDHRLASRDSVSADELDRENLLIVSPQVNPDTLAETQRFFAMRNVHPLYDARRISAPENYLDMVAASQGVAITLEALPDRPGVRRIPFVGATPAISNVYLVWRRGHRPRVIRPILEAAKKARESDGGSAVPALTG